MKKLLLGVCAAAFLFACSNADDKSSSSNAGDDVAYKYGYLVVNEGNFTQSNASISYISPNLSTMKHSIFANENNGQLLGDVAQSITFDGNYAYIVMNNSNMIQIVDRYSFEKIGSISEQMILPRYAAVSNGKLYVTNAGDIMESGDEFITVYDLATNAFIKKIDTDIVAENIFANDNYIYVGSNAWAAEHKVGIFDVNTDEQINTITFENQITGITKNSGDGIYVLESTNESAALNKIDGTNVVKRVTTTAARNAQHLVLNDGYLYTVANQNQVFKVIATLPNFSSNPSFSISESTPYGFNILNGNVFVADTDFIGNSNIVVYNLDGEFVTWFEAGVGTSKIYKN